MDRILLYLAKPGKRHPYLTLLFILLITLLAVFVAKDLTLEARLTPLLPEDVARQISEGQEEWKKGQFLFVIFEDPGKGDIGRYTPYILDVKKGVGELSAIKAESFQATLPPKEALEKFILSHGMLLLNDTTYHELEVTLTDLVIRERLSDAFTQNSQGNESNHSAREDPLLLLDFIKRQIPLASLIHTDPQGEYYLSKDGSLAFLVFSLTESASKTAFSRQIKEGVSQILKDSPVLERPQTYLTGPHLILLENHESLMTNFWMSGASTFVGILILFYLFFGRPLYLLYAGIGVLCGAIWTLAFAKITIGSLNMATMGVATIIIAIGIDLPAHLINRYALEIKGGRGHSEAVDTTWKKTGKASLYATLTTSGLFYLLLFTHLNGIQELGLLIGTGALLITLSVLLAIPALLTIKRSKAHGGISFMEMTGSKLMALYQKIMGRTRFILVFCVSLVVALTLGLLRLDIDFAEEDFFSRRNQSLRNLHHFESQVGTSLLPLYATIRSETLEGALTKEEEFRIKLEQLKDRSLISAYSSFSQWHPSRAHQDKIASWVPYSPNLNPALFFERYQEIASSLKTEGEGISTTHFKTPLRVEKAGGAGGRAPDRAQVVHEHERETRRRQDPQEIKPRGFEMGSSNYPLKVMLALNGLNMIDRGVLKKEGLDTITEYHLREGKGTGVKLRTSIYLPSQDTHSQQEFLDALLADNNSLKQGVQLNSPLAVMRILKDMMATDFFRMIVPSILVIFILLCLVFKNLRLAMIACLPVISGIAMTLGGASFFGGPMNLVNLLWIPTLIGLGIDYGIYLITHYHEKSQNIVEAVRSIARPLLFSALSTMLGFGSLILSDFPVIQQAGILMTLGIGWILIVTLFMVPALIEGNKCVNDVGE